MFIEVHGFTLDLQISAMLKAGIEEIGIVTVIILSFEKTQIFS